MIDRVSGHVVGDFRVGAKVFTCWFDIFYMSPSPSPGLPDLLEASRQTRLPSRNLSKAHTPNPSGWHELNTVRTQTSYHPQAIDVQLLSLELHWCCDAPARWEESQ